MPAFKDGSKRKKSVCREERIEKRKRRREIVVQSVNENELPHHHPHTTRTTLFRVTFYYITKIAFIAFYLCSLSRCLGFDLDAIINRLVRVV